jgi:hypothetical protein
LILALVKESPNIADFRGVRGYLTKTHLVLKRFYALFFFYKNYVKISVKNTLSFFMYFLV